MRQESHLKSYRVGRLRNVDCGTGFDHRSCAKVRIFAGMPERVTKEGL